MTKVDKNALAGFISGVFLTSVIAVLLWLVIK